MAKRKKRSYLGQLAAVAPAFAAKSVFGDMPKGALEKTVELRTAARPSMQRAYGKAGFAPVKRRRIKDLVRESFKGRGGGRALGGALGIATAPLYLKGIQLAGSKKKSDRRKGIGLLAGSGLIYAGVKGGVEGTQEARASGEKFRKALGTGKSVALSRMGYKPLGAIGMGLAVARKRSKGQKKKSKTRRMAELVGAGSLLGAGSRGIDQTVKQYRKASKSTRKGMFRPARLGKLVSALRPTMLGGAAGGAFGALVLDKVVDWAEASLKK